MKPLGTVLQSPKEQALSDKHFENEFQKQLVNASIKNKNLDKRFIHGTRTITYTRPLRVISSG
jgi:hypothetical protein